MKEHKALKNAPITEAFIDFKVNVPTSLDVMAALDDFEEQIRDQYPQVQTQFLLQGEIKLTAQSMDIGETSDRQITGKFYRSEDNLQVVQARLDGFSFHRLNPYTTWEEILPEALRIWAIYCAVFTPDAVLLLSVRFINHLSLPSTIDQLSDFLTALPRIPETMSQRLSNFLTRFTVAESDSTIETDITQGLAQISDDIASSATVVILDINTYKSFDGLDPGDLENITATLSKLRDIKNRTFLGSITERTVTLFS